MSGSAHSPTWKEIPHVPNMLHNTLHDSTLVQQVRREFPSVSEVPLIEEAIRSIMKSSQLEMQLKQATHQADLLRRLSAAETEQARKLAAAHEESRVARERATQADLLQKQARDDVIALRRESHLANIAKQQESLQQAKKYEEDIKLKELECDHVTTRNC